MFLVVWTSATQTCKTTMQAAGCFLTRGIRLTGLSPIDISEGRCLKRGYSTISTSLTSTSIARSSSSPDTFARLGASATFAADGTLSYHEIAPESCSHKRTCWMMVSPMLSPPLPETCFPRTASLSTNMTTLSFCKTASAGSSCRQPTKTANASRSKIMVSFALGLRTLMIPPGILEEKNDNTFPMSLNRTPPMPPAPDS